MITPHDLTPILVLSIILHQAPSPCPPPPGPPCPSPPPPTPPLPNRIPTNFGFEPTMLDRQNYQVPGRPFWSPN